MSLIPPPDQTGRILSHLDGGILASFSSSIWPGRSISYSDQSGRTCYINRLSAVKFLQQHGAAVDFGTQNQVILSEIEKFCSIVNKTKLKETEVLCPTIDKAEKFSLAKLGALIRGHQVRSLTVLPSRIKNFLSSRLMTSPSKADSSQMAILVCREINEKLAKPENRGNSFLVDSLKGITYSDYSSASAKKEIEQSNLNLKVDLWITISEDGKVVSLQFKAADASLLGQGGYKQVFTAEEIKLDMQPTQKDGEYSRKSVVPPSVRIKEVSKLSPKSSSFKRLERGAKQHKKAFLNLDKAKKKGLLQEIHLTTPHEELGPGASKQLRYASDMEKLVQKGVLAENFRPGAKQVKVTKVQLLQCVGDVARTLKWLNSQEITHRDVKLGNVNVSWGRVENKMERPLGYLADFDFANKGFGYDPLAFTNDYYVWDPCTSANIATPYTDLYGAAMMFCQVMKPDVNWKWFLDAKKSIELMVKADKSFDLDQYLPKGLDEHQQKAFSVFCNICFESSLLLKELEAKQGFPNSIDSKQVKDALHALNEKKLLKTTMDSLINIIDKEANRE